MSSKRGNEDDDEMDMEEGEEEGRKINWQFCCLISSDLSQISMPDSYMSVGPLESNSSSVHLKCFS